ncbi:MAG: xanthine dehydrogenase family protein molybdopterin-binding subunit [Proteobacteria bacterium]|nr:xanthine dehydrogenase family protein molybdopterin-binding subunit [Pseudomonadota bacterium]
MRSPETSSDLLPQAARRDFLRAGGALVVGLSLAACATPEGSGVRSGMRALPLRLREPQSTPPAADRVDSFLVIHEDSTVTLYTGFAELGQGTTTSLLQIAAEELDLGMDQIRAAPLDTHLSPNQGGTYSSASVQRGRPQITAAAAEARRALLALAATRLDADVARLSVARGRVRARKGGRSVSYGELIGGQRFELSITGKAPVKASTEYRLVGQKHKRADLAAKLTGQQVYIQQQRLPGMLHARVIRPRGQAAYGAGARVLRVDDSALASIPGARLLRRNDFLGVVAPLEWDAIRAAQAVIVEWESPPTLPTSAGLHAQMRAATTTDNVVLERGDVRVAADEAAATVVQRGNAPYQAHAPFAPNCALADIQPEGGLVICSSQDVHAARRGIAALVGLPAEKIRVQFGEGAGTYGHSCYDDVAQAAALLSQLAGSPVRVQFMRADEHGWDTYGPPHVGEARLACDANGRLVAYEYHGWQHNWSLVETTSQLAGAAPATEWPPVAVQGVNALVCGGMYSIPSVKLVNHRLPGLQYLRGAWLRSPLDLAFAFVSEQAIDQLAVQLSIDPVEMRRRNVKDERWRGVLDAVAEASQWNAARVPGRLGNERIRRGRGVGLGTHLISHGASVADIEVNLDSGQVRILHLYGALDAGLVVNPLTVEHQIEGQLVQTASRMLLEEVHFDAGRVTSLDWVGYPILRMDACPAVTPVVVQRMNERSTGAGEETMAAAAAAIANAFFDATGRRMEQFPFTPERVLETLKAV